MSETWQPGQFKTGEFGLELSLQGELSARSGAGARVPRRAARCVGSTGRGTGRICLQLVRPHARGRFRRRLPPCSFSTTVRAASRERNAHRQRRCPATAAGLDLGSELRQAGGRAGSSATLRARRAAVCTDLNVTSLHELPSLRAGVLREASAFRAGCSRHPRLSLRRLRARSTASPVAPRALIRRLAAGRVRLDCPSPRRGGGTIYRGDARRGQGVDLDPLPPPVSRSHLRDFRPVPNPILTEAIDRLCRGEALTADETAACLREVMEGRGLRGPDRGPADRASAPRARRWRRSPGMARAMRELARGGGDRARRPGRHRGHRRRAARRSTCRPPRRSSPRARAAGWPSTATARPPGSPARPTCSRRWAPGSTSSPEAVASCIDELGFGFMFAPAHHPAMKHVVPVRKELAVRTIFNFLGPLTNPAGAKRQLIGVSDRRFLDIMAAALGELGCEHALVVSSDDGLDELSVSGPTHVVELSDGAIDALHRHARGGGPGAARRRTRWRPGRPRRTPASRAQVLGRRAGRRARPDGAQRRRGDLRGRRRRLDRGRRARRPRRRSTPAPRATCSSASSRGREELAA